MSLSIRDRVDEIVALLQEAQLDDSAWPAASALIDDACGLQGNDLLLARFSPEGGIDIQLRWLLLRGEANPELEHDYAENYAAIDERPAAVVREPFGKLVHTNTLLSDRIRRDSATYNEYLVPNAGENCLNVRMPGRESRRSPGHWWVRGAAIRATGRANAWTPSGSCCLTCASSSAYDTHWPRPVPTA